MDVSRWNFEIAVSQELLVWLMWNGKEVRWYDSGPTVWHCSLTTPMTLTLEFQGQSLKLLYLRNGAADWHGTKRIRVIHSWPWYWLVLPWWCGRMYWIVNGVTSNVGVPSTYLVCLWCAALLGYFWNACLSNHIKLFPCTIKPDICRRPQSGSLALDMNFTSFLPTSVGMMISQEDIADPNLAAIFLSLKYSSGKRAAVFP